MLLVRQHTEGCIRKTFSMRDKAVGIGEAAVAVVVPQSNWNCEMKERLLLQRGNSLRYYTYSEYIAHCGSPFPKSVGTALNTYVLPHRGDFLSSGL